MAMGSQEASPVPPSDRQIGRRPEGKLTSLRPLAVQCTKRCYDSNDFMFGIHDSKLESDSKGFNFIKGLKICFEIRIRGWNHISSKVGAFSTTAKEVNSNHSARTLQLQEMGEERYFATVSLLSD